MDRPARIAQEGHDHAPPLPNFIRAQWGDSFFGWEYEKEYIRVWEDDHLHIRWRAKGWNVITTDGIRTYNLDGLVVRDRVIYA